MIHENNILKVYFVTVASSIAEYVWTL
jgi:hypothetical protein